MDKESGGIRGYTQYLIEKTNAARVTEEIKHWTFHPFKILGGRLQVGKRGWG